VGLAEVFEARKAYGELKQVLEHIVDVDEPNGGFWGQLGEVNGHLGLWDEAIQAYWTAIGLGGSPEQLATRWRGLIESYLAKGDREGAIEALRDGLERSPTVLKHELEQRLRELLEQAFQNQPAPRKQPGAMGFWRHWSWTNPQHSPHAFVRVAGLESTGLILLVVGLLKLLAVLGLIPVAPPTWSWAFAQSLSVSSLAISIPLF
jgi:tetratricopeptide (TPR) repeat protein